MTAIELIKSIAEKSSDEQEAAKLALILHKFLTKKKFDPETITLASCMLLDLIGEETDELPNILESVNTWTIMTAEQLVKVPYIYSEVLH